MAIEFVDPSQLRHKMKKNLVRHELNPSNCVCGWYRFTYAYCTHLFHAKHDMKCTKTLSRTGKPVFCRIPAPQNIVSNVKLKPEYPCPDPSCFSVMLPPQNMIPDPFDFDLNMDSLAPAPPAANLFQGVEASAPRQYSVDRMTPGLTRAAGQSTRGNSPAGSVHTVRTEEPSTPRGHARGQSLGPPISTTGSVPGSRSRQTTPQPARQQQQGGSPSAQASARKGVGATPPPAAGNRRAAPGGAAGASVGRGVR